VNFRLFYKIIVYLIYQRNASTQLDRGVPVLVWCTYPSFLRPHNWGSTVCFHQQKIRKLYFEIVLFETTIRSKFLGLKQDEIKFKAKIKNQ